MKLIKSNIQIYEYIAYSCIFILFLSSLDPWFFWDKNTSVNAIAFCTLTFSTIKISSKLFNYKKKIAYISLFLYSFLLLWTEGFKYLFSFSFWVNLLVIGWLLFLKNEKSIKLFEYIIKIFVIINGISLIAWILFLIGINLPSYYVEHSVYNYDNYYFFLYNRGFLNMFLPRFSGIIIEPGHLSMVCAFLLHINGLTLRKKENIVLFICLILSFSLSGYILYVFSYLYYKVYIKQKYKEIILISAITLFIGIPFALSYNSGDNALNQLIISRLEYSDGELQGNNRNEEGFELFYENTIKGDKLLFGIGKDEWSKVDYINCSYKTFICTSGLIGIIFLILLYISLLKPYKNKYTIGLFILYILSFWQRPYALMRYELFIFILGIIYLKYSCNINDRKNGKN